MPLDVTSAIASRKTGSPGAGSVAPDRVNSGIRADSESPRVPSAASAASSIHPDVGADTKSAVEADAKAVVGTDAKAVVGTDANAVKVTARSAAFNVLCEQLLAVGHTARFVASGQSMQPTILGGDLLVVEPLSGAEPKRGQILLTRTAGKLRAHRAVTMHPCLITRGDSGLENDPPADKVLGRVIALERGSETISLEGRAAIFMQRLRIAAHRVTQALRLRLTSLDG